MTPVFGMKEIHIYKIGYNHYPTITYRAFSVRQRPHTWSKRTRLGACVNMVVSTVCFLATCCIASNQSNVGAACRKFICRCSTKTAENCLTRILTASKEIWYVLEKILMCTLCLQFALCFMLCVHF